MGDRAATMAQIAANTATPDEDAVTPGTPDEDELDAAAGASPSPIEKVKEGTEKSQEDDEEKDEDEEADDTLEQAKDQLQASASRIHAFFSDAWSSLNRVPIPGDIFVPISILLFFWLLILPVNGHTRASWLFLALTGNAHIA